MKIKIYILFLFLINFVESLAQQKRDSLWQVWKNEALADTVRLQAIDDFIWENYLYSNTDSAIYYTKIEYDFARNKKNIHFQAQSLSMQGSAYFLLGDYANAIGLHKKVLKLNMSINNKQGIAASYGNIANIYTSQGNYAMAIEYYSRCRKIMEAIANKLGMASCYSNIGRIYNIEGEAEKAIESYEKGITIFKEIKNDPGISNSYNNIGAIYHQLNKTKKALIYYNKSLQINVKIGDKRGEAMCLNNIGHVYSIMKDNDKAMEYYFKSVEIRKSNDDKRGLSSTYNNIGNVYYDEGKYLKAIEFSLQAFKISSLIGEVLEHKNAANSMYKSYKALGDIENALPMFEIYVKLNDSIMNDDNQKALIQQQFKYIYEKQYAADSVKRIEEKKVTSAKLKQEQTQRYALYGGLSLAIIFGIFMFNRLRITRKQKNIIEGQKKLVEEQKHLVEEKQKEVMDSIRYAKRIQIALLPQKTTIEKNLIRLKEEHK